MKKIIITIMMSSILFISLQTLFADEKGERIAKAFFDLPESNSFVGDMSLVIIDSKNNKRVRQVKQYSRNVKGGSESYVEFLSPSDVRGTKFLTISRDGKDDEQRLFLPALGKVRRIASSDKGASFMGTDLNYYDLEDHDFADYTFRFIEARVLNGTEVDMVEAISKDKDAPYSKQFIYYRKDTHFPLQMESYDEDGKFYKTIIYLETKVYDGVIVATKIVVDNKRDNQKTLMQVKNVAVNVKVPDQVFSIQNLER